MSGVVSKHDENKKGGIREVGHAKTLPHRAQRRQPMRRLVPATLQTEQSDGRSQAQGQ